MFGGALMMVLGAIVAGNGYGWGTWKTVFTQGPSRAAAVLGLDGRADALRGRDWCSPPSSLDFGLSLAGRGRRVAGRRLAGPGPTWRSRSARGLLVMEMWALTGYFLGTVARGPALSVGLGLVWALVIENLLRGVGTLLEAGRRVHPRPARHGRRLADRLHRRRRRAGPDPRRPRHAVRATGTGHDGGLDGGAAAGVAVAGQASRRGLTEARHGVRSGRDLGLVGVDRGRCGDRWSA